MFLTPLLMARWSRGMILALGARGPGFKSRTSPTFLYTLLVHTFLMSVVRSVVSRKTLLLRDSSWYRVHFIQ